MGLCGLAKLRRLLACRRMMAELCRLLMCRQMMAAYRIFKSRVRTRETLTTGGGFSWVVLCQPSPILQPTCALNPRGFVNPSYSLVSWITCDNTSNNMMMLRHFEGVVNISNLEKGCEKWDHKMFHIRKATKLSISKMSNVVNSCIQMSCACNQPRNTSIAVGA